jgi:phosphoglycolate phosphatase
MKKIVLLDFDGTLGDTAPGITRSVAYALEKLGRPKLTPAELKEFVGPPIFEAMRDAGVPEARIEEGITLYREAYSKPTFELQGHEGELTAGMFDARPYPGVEEMLAGLQSHSSWFVITGTSKPEQWAREIIAKFDFLKFLTPVPHLNVIGSGEKEHQGKASPHHVCEDEGYVAKEEVDGVFGASMDKSRAKKGDVLQYALDAVGFDPKEDVAVLVGDRSHDINGARRVGIPVIGCSWGYANPGELDPADFVIDTPSELEPLLKEVFREK